MPGEHLLAFVHQFTNLSRGQQAEFEKALADSQNLKELTSLETSLKQLKRKPNQLLPIPQPTVNTTVRGGVVTWPPLPDQRINFYEVDISDFSNFSSFTTTSTFANSIVIDGLTSSVFVRVRGVRRDGTTSPYSSGVEINPNLFDLRSHVDENFYVSIEGTDAVLVVGGQGTDMVYTPINPNGNSMIWGFASIYGDPAVAMYGSGATTGGEFIDIRARVLAKVKDILGNEVSETTLAEETVGEFFGTYSFGPFIVNHPELNQSLEVRMEVQDNTKASSGGSIIDRSNDSTEVLYAHLNSMELGIGDL